jgi:hypothetical protein
LLFLGHMPEWLNSFTKTKGLSIKQHPTTTPSQILFTSFLKKQITSKYFYFYIIFTFYITSFIFYYYLNKKITKNKTLLLFNTTFSLFYINYYTLFFFLTKHEHCRGNGCCLPKLNQFWRPKNDIVHWALHIWNQDQNWFKMRLLPSKDFVFSCMFCCTNS